MLMGNIYTHLPIVYIPFLNEIQYQIDKGYFLSTLNSDIVTFSTKSEFEQIAQECVLGKKYYITIHVKGKDGANLLLDNVLCDKDERFGLNGICISNTEVRVLGKGCIFASSFKKLSTSQLQNVLAPLIKEEDKRLFLFLKGIPLHISLNFEKLFMGDSVQDAYIYMLRKLGAEKVVSYIFLDIARAECKYYLDRSFWKIALSNKLPNFIFAANDSFSSQETLDKKSGSKEVIYIFPDAIIPANRAFLMRGLDLVVELSYNNVNVNLIIISSRKKEHNEVANILYCLCASINIVERKIVKYPLGIRLKKTCEKIFRQRIFGIDHSAPMTFIERASRFSIDFYSDKLSDIFDQIDCRSGCKVIVTGAWFYPIVERIKNKYDFEYFCDTHDIFFVMDAHSNRNEKRLFYSEKYNKSKELEYLRGYNKIIAISNSDKLNILPFFNEDSIVTASGSFQFLLGGEKEFSWDLSEVEKSIDSDPLNDESECIVFGFVGSKNPNNILAIEYLFNSWWPKVINMGRTCKIILCGSICNSEHARRYKNMYDETVVLAGFVDNLSDFYNRVHIVLSPVIVQGGLNFKSVEALVSGKALITTEIGSKCVSEVELGVYATNDIGEAISSYFNDLKKYNNYSEIVSNSALEYFGNDNGIKEILDAL